jgi:hypothetical protein
MKLNKGVAEKRSGSRETKQEHYSRWLVVLKQVEVNVERRNSGCASEVPQTKNFRHTRYAQGFPEVP